MYRLLERGGMKQIGVKVNEMLLTICKGQIHEYSRPLIKGKAMVFSQIRGKKVRQPGMRDCREICG